MSKCPTCDSPSSHLHPSVQYEGEVETCPDAFHLKRTSQNGERYIALVEEKRAALSKPVSGSPEPLEGISAQKNNLHNFRFMG
jgi:hypothetical protein